MTARTDANLQSPIANKGYTNGNVRRFLKKLDVASPCWQWGGCINKEGYGRVTVNGVSQYAHRVAWLMFVGPVPDGLELDHLCRNRSCVNPDHLEPVTRSVNVSRGASKALVHNAREVRYGRAVPSSRR
jgi:hypothetical protein